MAMIFSLMTFLEDWIVSQLKGAKQKRFFVLEDTGSTSDSANESKTTLIEEKVLAAGTPVTQESFMKWQKAFLAETANTATVQQSVNGKLTGKQLFEQNKGLVASDAGFAEEGDVVIDESLFANINFGEADDDEIVYDNNGNISD